MKKKSFLLIGIGILFIGSPFFFDEYNLLRLVSVLLGILFLSLGFLVTNKKNVFKILFYPLFFLILIYGMDIFFVSRWNRVPIFAYQNKTEETFSTFDSFLYRVYNCKDNRIFDFFYNQNYVCDYSLEPKEVNAFLSNGANNYQKYRSKFITVKGKVSEVFGNEYLLLQTYEQKENNLVGQLTFNKNTTLKVENNHGNLKLYNKYEIYDNVLVTGRIVKKEANTLIMQDAKIEVINNFEEFMIHTIEEKKCNQKIKKLTSTGEYTFYSDCLSEIFVKYDKDTIYDIILALETKKLTFDKWIKDVERKENEEKELYFFSQYNLLKCKNSNTILIGNKKLKLNSKFCEEILEKESWKKLEKIDIYSKAYYT